MLAYLLSPSWSASPPLLMVTVSCGVLVFCGFCAAAAGLALVCELGSTLLVCVLLMELIIRGGSAARQKTLTIFSSVVKTRVTSIIRGSQVQLLPWLRAM